MARNTSPALELQYRFPRHAHLYLKIKTSNQRAKFRKALRTYFPSAVRNMDPGVAMVSPAFDAGKSHYVENGWSFVDEFWDPTFHETLVDQWPGDRYFNPIRHITKSYDLGFQWARIEDKDPAYLNEFPALNAAYKFLASEAFCERVTAVAGDGIKRSCKKIILTRAYWGSSVIPHHDGSNDKDHINLVIFVNGTGGERAGGLGIWKDNEFKEKIFEPTNLKNTCLFYNLSDAFYHGFAPMRFGTYRWSINAAYFM